MKGKRIAVAMSVLLLGGAVGAEPKEEPEWGVCRIVSTLPDGKKLELTGFKALGVRGIYTALHGVHGAEKVNAIFHDPKTRHVRLKLAKVDIPRDIALMVPAGEGDENRLPKGLGLGVRTPADEVEAKFAGRAASVVGYPWGIDLRTATTELKIRRPAVAELTDLLNPGARKELKDRGSPDKGMHMLSLQGPFLPGHSGAPILDAEGALIGIGIGGLGGGKVGHGWAAPIHDVELRPVADPDIAKQLAELPVHNSTYSFFLVVDAEVRKKPDGKAGVKTTVESEDGTPILALRRKPGDEINDGIERLKVILDALGKGEHDKFNMRDEGERMLENRVLLPSGTQVEIVSEPEKFKIPEEAKKGALGDFVTTLYTRVRPATKDAEPLWVPSVAIRRRAAGR